MLEHSVFRKFVVSYTYHSASIPLIKLDQSQSESIVCIFFCGYSLCVGVYSFCCCQKVRNKETSSFFGEILLCGDVDKTANPPVNICTKPCSTFSAWLLVQTTDASSVAVPEVSCFGRPHPVLIPVVCQNQRKFVIFRRLINVEKQKTHFACDVPLARMRKKPADLLLTVLIVK